METIHQHPHHFKRNPMKKFIFGILILLTGSLLLAFNLGALPVEYKRIVFSWQMLLIAIGLINLFSKDSYIFGAILIIIGGYFIIPKAFPGQTVLLSTYWPVLLIFLGLIIILKKGFFNFHNRIKKTTTDSSFIEEVNIFGGNKHKVNAPSFKGGKIVNVFGGSHIDLSHTQLEEGKNILELVCVFGGVELIIPSDWIIHVETASVLGGFADKRININPQTTGNKELFIKGVVVFGGGEIKSYA